MLSFPFNVLNDSDTTNIHQNNQYTPLLTFYENFNIYIFGTFKKISVCLQCLTINKKMFSQNSFIVHPSESVTPITSNSSLIVKHGRVFLILKFFKQCLTIKRTFQLRS